MRVDELRPGTPRAAQAVQRPVQRPPLAAPGPVGRPERERRDYALREARVELLEQQLKPLGYRVGRDTVAGIRLTTIGRGDQAIYLLDVTDETGALTLARTGLRFDAGRRVYVTSDRPLSEELSVAVGQWANDGVLVDKILWDDLAAYAGAQLAGFLRLPPARPAPPSTERTRVFLSCHPDDDNWRELVRRFLSPVPNVWDTTDIPTGAERSAALEEALRATRVAVVLVTQSYLADPALMDGEFRRFLAAHGRDELKLVWVAVKFATYDKYEMGELQAFNDIKHPLQLLRDERESAMNKELVRLSDEVSALVTSAG